MCVKDAPQLENLEQEPQSCPEENHHLTSLFCFLVFFCVYSSLSIRFDLTLETFGCC